MFHVPMKSKRSCGSAQSPRRARPPRPSSRISALSDTVLCSASSPPKKGPHRCHVATFGALGFAEYTLTMEKGRRDRWEEDGLASMLVVQALADAAAESEATGDTDDIIIGNIKNSDKAAMIPIDVVGRHVVSPGDVMERTSRPLGDPLEYLASGAGDVVEYTRGACTAVGVAPQPNNCVVLPGEFILFLVRAIRLTSCFIYRIVQPDTRWAPRDATRGAFTPTEW